jgi:malonate transporter
MPESDALKRRRPVAVMIINALVPIFFGLGLGFFAGRRGIVDNRNITGLNTFLLSFALPAALFLATAQMPRQSLAYHGKLFLVLALSMIVMFSAGLIVERKLFKFTLVESSAVTLTIALPNWVAVGLPLFIGLYGSESIVTVAVAIVCGNVVAAPMSLLLLEAGGMQSSSAGPLSRLAFGLWRSLKKPIVLGPLFGMCFSLAGYTLAPVWVRSLGFFAQTAAGVGLFVTGLVLSRESLVIDSNVLGGLVLKLLFQPFLAFVIAAPLLHYPTQVVRDAVLLMACPSGFLGVLFGIAYDARSREAGSLLLLSSTASALTISAVILLLPLIR